MRSWMLLGTNYSVNHQLMLADPASKDIIITCQNISLEEPGDEATRTYSAQKIA